MTEKPKTSFQAGPVHCAVWESQIVSYGQSKVVLRAIVGKRYQGRDGQWKTSSYLSQNEIPLAINCLQQAFDWMVKGQDRLTEEVITTDD